MPLLQLTLGRTMKAVVVLRGLIIEWVLVKGYNEDFMTDDDQVGNFQKTIWHSEAEAKWPPFRRRHFKCISLNENVIISIKISLKFVPKGPINNIPALV